MPNITPTTHTPFAQRLTEKLGPAAVLTAPEDIAPWLSDWRGLYSGQAQAVVRPANTAEIAACITLCADARVPVVPRGGNTGLCGGATPDANPGNVVLSLERMHAIRSISTTDNTLVAEAGCILGNLRRAAAEARRLLPLSLAAEDSCQLGGNLSTNAGGVNVVRYGMTRELVLGIEAVLPNGTIYHGLRTLRKDNTGYDLKQLLIGAEGTLGVITAAALKLYPRNDARVVVVAAVASPQDALDLFKLLFEQCGQRMQAFEFFTGECVDLVVTLVDGLRAPFAECHPGYVLIELADTVDEDALRSLTERVIGAALEQQLCADAVISTTISQLNSLWRLREEISEALRADGPHLKHDVSLPIAAIPDFLVSVDQRVRKLCPDIRPIVFGHFGDGNLHYNLSRPLGAPGDFFAKGDGCPDLTDAVLDEVARYDGSISAEHGIGQLKRDHFKLHTDPLEVTLMREIRQLFDPYGIMNPGKIF
jgi:FAD/FMN-containing dehydrogenase